MSAEKGKLPRRRFRYRGWRVTCIVAFQHCCEVYFGAREVLGQPKSAPAFNVRDHYLYRPDLKPGLEGFFIDFTKACAAAKLEGPAHDLCHLVYLQGWKSEEAMARMGLTREQFGALQETIYLRCGQQMIARGLYPPNKYFS